MKKSLCFVYTLLSVLILLSCPSDNNKNNDDDDDLLVLDDDLLVLDDKLFGKWYISEAAAESGEDTYVMYEFKDDGTLPWTAGVSFDYEADGERLSGTYAGYDLGYDLGSAKYVIDGKKLTLSDVKNGDFGAFWVAGDYYGNPVPIDD
jgi:hypothetical protein